MRLKFKKRLYLTDDHKNNSREEIATPQKIKKLENTSIRREKYQFN